jgi:SOS-response transcriptional repressor LexA
MRKYKNHADADAILGRIMEITGLTKQVELANLLGVRRAAITDAKRRGAIPTEWLVRLCRDLGANPAWLETGEGPCYVGGIGAEPAAAGGFSSQEFSFVPMVKARISGGGGSLETDAEIEAYYAFRHEWLRRKGQIGQMRLMRVTGDSMEPTLRDEDMVLIDLSQADILPGKIFAVRIDDQIVVKRLDKRPGRLMLISDNRALYQPLEVDLDESVGVEVIGRVIWMAREVM